MVVRIIICALMLLLGAYLIWSTLSQSRKCTVDAIGTVVGIESKLVHGSKRSHREYSPVVEFDVDGKTIWKKADISSRSKTKYPEGSTLEIRYDPQDPENFMVKGKSMASGLLYGILLMLIGGGGIFLFTR